MKGILGESLRANHSTPLVNDGADGPTLGPSLHSYIRVGGCTCLIVTNFVYTTDGASSRWELLNIKMAFPPRRRWWGHFAFPPARPSRLLLQWHL